jgi:predicted nucleic acid-binding protein
LPASGNAEGVPPVIVDTSALLAFFDASEPDHEAVSDVLGAADALVVSPYVVAELDYLVATRHGVDAELAVLEELTGGAWDLAAFDRDGLRRSREVISRYRDQEIGVADASIVVLAERYRTRRIATLDHRHFDVLRPLDGGYLEVLPHVG